MLIRFGSLLEIIPNRGAKDDPPPSGLGGAEAELDITDGAKVKIKQTPSINGRPHLLQHARQGDVGAIAGPPQRSPKMANLYVIVRFDQCGQNHRLLKEEIAEA